MPLSQPSVSGKAHSYPLCQGEKGYSPPRRTRALRVECDGEAGRCLGELDVHQHKWEGELESTSSPSGAPLPRLDEACAPAPLVHALGASNRLGQVFMVRRGVPCHAFMPRCSASTSSPCSCSRAGALLWGGLASTGRDGGAVDGHLLLPRCSSSVQHPHHLFSSVPTVMACYGHGGSTLGMGWCSQEQFQGCSAGMGSTLGWLCPLSCMRPRVV